MNRECRWCGAGAIDVQKRYLLRGTREPASAILSARGDDQAGLGGFDSDFLTKVGSAFTLSASSAEGISLPRKKLRAAMIWAATVN